MTSAELALRIELADEIKARLKKPHDELVLQLNANIKQHETDSVKLLNKISELEGSYENTTKLKVQSLKQERKIGELNSELTSLRHKFKVNREANDKIKKEHAQFKALNPIQTKKKLEDLKRKLKDKTKTQDEWGTERRQLLSIIGSHKKQLEKQSQSSSVDNYLFHSKCDNYRVLGTYFKSESHPFVIKDMNYRVLDMRTGASYVAQWNGDIASFSEEILLPEEIIGFIESSIGFSLAQDKK